ncbi:putative dienelactone hydrolase [Kutzneria kofuensis]|uniref:Putative dienelactone hydrolase n=1 Tax=Kutzneria kofuensis TaxID=103725 RepID=A0A7W9KQI6_9PSEU|nr:putative dienelactone hydrolase [Kutzneria kofuensis]
MPTYLTRTALPRAGTLTAALGTVIPATAPAKPLAGHIDTTAGVGASGHSMGGMTPTDR